MLVCCPAFKAVGFREQRDRWVRFPCAPANSSRAPPPIAATKLNPRLHRGPFEATGAAMPGNPGMAASAAKRAGGAESVAVALQLPQPRSPRRKSETSPSAEARVGGSALLRMRLRTSSVSDCETDCRSTQPSTASHAALFATGNPPATRRGVKNGAGALVPPARNEGGRENAPTSSSRRATGDLPHPTLSQRSKLVDNANDTRSS